MMQKILLFLKEIFLWAKSGFNLSNLYFERLSICERCPEYDEDKMKCNVCGCNMKYKARMSSAQCPLKKW
jgi:hypothetical protein